MKNIIEILGGAQILLGFFFTPDVLFEKCLSKEHKACLIFLRVVEENLPDFCNSYSGMGRARYDDISILRAVLDKSIFQIEKNNLLKQRLLGDINLRIRFFLDFCSRVNYNKFIRRHYFPL